MRRSAMALAGLVGFSVACGGSAASVPDVPVASPEPAPVAAAPVESLANSGGLKFAFSTWRVEWIGQNQKMILTFMPGGAMSDKDWPNDVSIYKLDGNNIHMEYNSGATIYDGEFVDPYTMGGTFYQPDGQYKGAWKGVRIE